MIKTIYDIDSLDKMKDFVRQMEFTYNYLLDCDKDTSDKLEFHYYIEFTNDDGVEQVLTYQLI